MKPRSQRSPPSPDAIAAANARAAASARPPSAPAASIQSALEPPQSHSEGDDTSSVTGNASVSSYNSSTREMHRRAIATAFFGPNSTRTEVIAESDEEEQLPSSQRSLGGSSRGSRRRRRRGSSDGLLHRVFRQRTASDSALPAQDSASAAEAEREPVRKQASLPIDRAASDPPPEVEETPEQRAKRKENCELFQDLVHKANTHQPVQFDTFRQRSSRKSSSARSRRSSALRSQLRPSGSDEAHEITATSSSDEEEGSEDEGDVEDEKINTELLEAYIAYSKSIGHEPNIQLDPGTIPFGTDHKPRDSHVDDEEMEEDRESQQLFAHRASYIQERPVLPEHQHLWTKYIGTRYSKRRGCVQFWVWLAIGVGIVVWLGLSLSALQLNEVLHLDAFVVQNVQVTQDFTFLHFLEEVDFHLKYTIEAPDVNSLNASTNANASYFMALLLTEDAFEHYVQGEPFEYVSAGSTLRTTYATLPITYIVNEEEEDMYFVVQPCYLERNPTADYCQTSQLPTSVRSSEKIYNLDQPKKMRKKEAWEHFNVTYMSVNPMPVSCSASGWRSGTHFLLFVPYLVILFFSLRVFQMLVHCESFQANLERNYTREFAVPEEEVDYWQPMPWDRKVPKTRLCGPCCWKKFRRPYEPFYTWWRHENYFTWVFCPYRNERLSRGERALIVVCSLYITFYVLFLIVMLRDSVGTELTLFTSVVMYAILVSILPSAGKAIFKELFKLIFRQRRKYFRGKAAGGDLKGFSVRLAFLLQVMVAVILTLAQVPIFYIWLYRSCLFLQKFMYFGVLAAVMRMSIMGLAQDFAWFLILKTWGWKDLCPYCTERIKHCDCFNDELLVLGVEGVGPKWELIRVLDRLLAKQHHYDPQFELYTTEQLRERWDVLVDRAEKHMEKIEKLRAYQEKQRLEKLRHERQRRSFTSFLSFRGGSQAPELEVDKLQESEEVTTTRRKSSEEENSTSSSTDEAKREDSEPDLHICSLREKKVLALNSKIQLDGFEKHYDSSIADVFHALTHSVMKLREHGKHKHKSKRKARAETPELEQIPEEQSGVEPEFDTATTHRGSSGSSSSDGETMWVFDTPAQRLERREEEKLRRKRAFRVLKDYEIKSLTDSEPLLSGQDSLSASGAVPLSTSRLSRRDSRKMPLLSTRHKESTPKEEDLVVIMPDTYDKYSKDPLDSMASECVADDYDDEEDDEHPADLERGHGQAAAAPPSTNKVYAVRERPQTLYRRVSASATAFAAWALNYDPNAGY
ncbi:hypothetical protein BBJ28_00021794 [Nothophytophthora sp. Chile5]|nr:hypothetical protein BBJ28_00021794 [Nothophytophthora sp. Chile5]